MPTKKAPVLCSQMGSGSVISAKRRTTETRGRDGPGPGGEVRLLVEVAGREDESRREEQCGERVEVLGRKAGEVSNDLIGSSQATDEGELKQDGTRTKTRSTSGEDATKQCEMKTYDGGSEKGEDLESVDVNPKANKQLRPSQVSLMPK
jgi:hypothetical protein